MTQGGTSPPSGYRSCRYSSRGALRAPGPAPLHVLRAAAPTCSEREGTHYGARGRRRRRRGVAGRVPRGHGRVPRRPPRDLPLRAPQHAADPRAGELVVPRHRERGRHPRPPHGHRRGAHGHRGRAAHRPGAVRPRRPGPRAPLRRRCRADAGRVRPDPEPAGRVLAQGGPALGGRRDHRRRRRRAVRGRDRPVRGPRAARAQRRPLPRRRRRLHRGGHRPGAALPAQGQGLDRGDRLLRADRRDRGRDPAGAAQLAVGAAALPDAAEEAVQGRAARGAPERAHARLAGCVLRPHRRQAAPAVTAAGGRAARIRRTPRRTTRQPGDAPRRRRPRRPRGRRRTGAAPARWPPAPRRA